MFNTNLSHLSSIPLASGLRVFWFMSAVADNHHRVIESFNLRKDIVHIAEIGVTEMLLNNSPGLAFSPDCATSVSKVPSVWVILEHNIIYLIRLRMSGGPDLLLLHGIVELVDANAGMVWVPRLNIVFVKVVGALTSKLVEMD